MRTGEWLCAVSSCCVLLAILTCASADAQPADPDPVRAHAIASLEGGLPPLETVPVASVPRINAAALAADALQTRRGTGPLRVASVARTNISAFRAQGVVDESQVGDGDPQLTWRLRVAAPGAASIGLGFTRYQMPRGGGSSSLPRTTRMSSGPSRMRTMRTTGSSGSRVYRERRLSSRSPSRRTSWRTSRWRSAPSKGASWIPRTMPCLIVRLT